MILHTVFLLNHTFVGMHTKYKDLCHTQQVLKDGQWTTNNVHPAGLPKNVMPPLPAVDADL